MPVVTRRHKLVACVTAVRPSGWRERHVWVSQTQDGLAILLAPPSVLLLLNIPPVRQLAVLARGGITAVLRFNQNENTLSLKVTLQEDQNRNTGGGLPVSERF